MEQNWLTIEQNGQEVVLTKCSDEAKGEIIIPEGVTIIGAHSFRECPYITSITIPDSVMKIGDYAFLGSNISSVKFTKGVKFWGHSLFYKCDNLKYIIINGMTFRYAEDTGKFDLRNIYMSSHYHNETNLTSEEINSAFRILLKNFLLHKDNILNILKGASKMSIENAYYYVECFLYDHYDELSSENIKYAERFLEHFSRSDVSGPTYAYRILTGDITFGERGEELLVAAKRLAAAVYNLDTPWGPFSTANSTYLAKMFQKGWINKESQEENNKKAAIVLCRNRTPEISDSAMFNELGVDVVDLLKNELNPYYQKSWNHKKPIEELGRFSIINILKDVAKDICLSIAPKEELDQAPFLSAAIVFFSNIENYPDLSEIDIDAIINGIQEEIRKETEKSNQQYEEEILESLRLTYETMHYRIHFKQNEKYKTNYSNIFYIGFSDMRDDRYCIRERKSEKYDDDNDPIVAEYYSMKEILNDGWYPD